MNEGPIPFQDTQTHDATLFYVLTGFAAVWWIWQLIRLPGMFNELQSRIRDLGSGQSILPFFMHLFFLFVWWVVPLVPIIATWERYGRYLQYIQWKYFS